MNVTQLEKFTEAYKGSTVDPAAVQAVYAQWIDFKLKSLGELPVSIRDEVLSGMADDRARVIAHAPADAKPTQLVYDRIWTELWPIDRNSEALAQLVRRGQALPDQDRKTLQSGKEQLSRLTVEIQHLPPDLRQHFSEVVSETTLDISYALHGGSGPVSMRLGRSE